MRESVRSLPAPAFLFSKQDIEMQKDDEVDYDEVIRLAREALAAKLREQREAKQKAVNIEGGKTVEYRV